MSLTLLLAPGLAGAVAGAGGTSDKLLAQIQDTARRHLLRQAENAGLREPLFDVEVIRSAKPVPACGEPVQVEGIDTRTPSRMRFAAACRTDTPWRIEFVVRAHVSASVAVAVAALPAGKPYAAADLTLERRDVTATPDPVSDLERAVGMTGRRALRAGDVLRESLLAAPLLVRRGEAVSIVVRREQIEISVAGEAMEAGARDAQVRVRNVSTGNIIRARVVGPAMVEPVGTSLSTQSPE
ncbi:flagellar basal body P-ring formation chaperone FlgA [Undibacterium sp. TJN25]|uniref:flagellar basal body P-ring formation chaperone FlgA n=1 Tax=Undibacterium sp. TJN25 TaxID=3413056 RepID=UPI003BF13D0A